MQPTLTSQHLGQIIRTLLSDAGIPEPSAETDRIICHVVGIERSSLHAHPDRIVRGEDFERIVEFAVRRAAHEPLAYILGSSLFCGMTLKVDRHTLIPRPETEILCDIANDLLKKLEETNAPGFGGILADWCTGSGALAVSLASRNPGWRCFAVDSSRGALAAARENARINGVSGQIEFIECSDPEHASPFIPDESLDLVVANPPYIPSSELAGLETQVGAFEPRCALDGGPDGLDVYRLLFRTLPRYMKKGAPLLLETAGGEQISALLKEAAKTAEKLVPEPTFEDHRGMERFMLWRKSV